jgi:hypothetical protein
VQLASSQKIKITSAVSKTVQTRPVLLELALWVEREKYGKKWRGSGCSRIVDRAEGVLALYLAPCYSPSIPRSP